MKTRRTLQDLTLKDNFMFAAVMMDTDICKRFLEMVLQIPIASITVDSEKSIFNNPKSHGVRLDVYAKDNEQRHYNIEMQVRRHEVIKRSRYYHAQIDTDCFLSGYPYDSIPDTYVIFICDYDPFMLGKYQYTVRKCLAEIPDYEYDDGSYSIFLNTTGTNDQDVMPELIHFLNFVHTGSSDTDDDFVNQLQCTINKIKNLHEMREQYMLLEEYLQEERAEGKAEGLTEGLFNGKIESILLIIKNKFSISSSDEELIRSIRNEEKLNVLLQAAAASDTPQDFENVLATLK